MEENHGFLFPTETMSSRTNRHFSKRTNELIYTVHNCTMFEDKSQIPPEFLRSELPSHVLKEIQEAKTPYKEIHSTMSIGTPDSLKSPLEVKSTYCPISVMDDSTLSNTPSKSNAEEPNVLKNSLLKNTVDVLPSSEKSIDLPDFPPNVIINPSTLQPIRVHIGGNSSKKVEDVKGEDPPSNCLETSTRAPVINNKKENNKKKNSNPTSKKLSKTAPNNPLTTPKNTVNSSRFDASRQLLEELLNELQGGTFNDNQPQNNPRANNKSTRRSGFGKISPQSSSSFIKRRVSPTASSSSSSSSSSRKKQQVHKNSTTKKSSNFKRQKIGNLSGNKVNRMTSYEDYIAQRSKSAGMSPEEIVNDMLASLEAKTK
eukprot:TRINITY_DN445_c0_g1_i1.p1 TRINITY_DN445_c0_g1~~TRINITY_DN445_c0_g1_i1.p1  ORF type:complete len:371 (+),score=95.76 TRINITY_DN445_c0_g1_i1:158-1270(+)